MKAFFFDLMLVVVSLVISSLICLFTFNFPLTEAIHEWTVYQIHFAFCSDFGNHYGDHDIGFYYLLFTFLGISLLIFNALSERYKKENINPPQTSA